MNFLKKMYVLSTEHYFSSAILIFITITTLSYIINPISIFYSGDIDYLFGVICATVFMNKNSKNKEIKPLTFLVGLILSAILTTISIGLLILLLKFSSISNLIQTMTYLLIVGEIIALFIGIIAEITVHINKNQLMISSDKEILEKL